MFKYSWHLGFAIAFVIVFGAGLVWAYRTDIRKTAFYYKGSWKAVAGIVLVGVLTYLVVRFMLYSMADNL